MVNFERIDMPLRTLGAGTQLYVPIFRFTGEAGKRVYVQANIHGPEIAGCGAIYELIRYLRTLPTLHGSITLVPSVNPVGLDTKINNLQVGYCDLNDSSAANWNRIYTLLVPECKREGDAKPHEVDTEAFVAAHRESEIQEIVRDFEAALGEAWRAAYEKRARHGIPFGHKLALAVQEMALAHDYVLDLHTAGDALYHIYAFDGCMDAVKFWRIPYAIELADEFSGALDEACVLPWLRLQKAFGKVGRAIDFSEFGKEAFTVELGSADTLSREAMHADAERVINYLRARGVLPGEARAGEVPYVRCTHDDYVRYAAPTGGFLVWEKALGDDVAAGETFATVIRPYALGGSAEEAAEVPVVAREAGILMNRTSTHVVQEGMSICAVMTNVRPG